MQTCDDCKGSGKYVGFLQVEDCLKCGGKGQIGSPYSAVILDDWSFKVGDIIEGPLGIRYTITGVSADPPGLLLDGRPSVYGFEWIRYHGFKPR